MESDVLVKVEKLCKYFPVKKRLLSRHQNLLKAVDGINFEIKRREILCLVGESGSGKTTTGMLLVRLLSPTEGKVHFQGLDIFSIGKEEFRKIRPNIQMIFQDPYESISPRMTVFATVAEPLIVNKLKDDMEGRVEKALEEVQLRPADEFYDRYPHELSGGQRQRVAIARTIILQPKFVVADEPVSMLDSSSRAEILELMLDLKKTRDLSYLYITHDLALADYISDHIAVMYLGKIVEIGPAKEIVRNAQHPYTKALISAVPKGDPTCHLKAIIKGDITSPIDPPECCRFAPRCSNAQERCNKKEPLLATYKGVHRVACHRMQ